MNRMMGWGLAVVFLFFGGSMCFADQAAQGANFEKQREEWSKLKKENPEKFKEEMAKRREVMHQRLEELKKSDPKKYEEVEKRIMERRQQRLEYLKQQDPEKFKQMMAQRRSKYQERMEALKTSDPEKYKAMKAREEELRKLYQLRKDDPEAFKKYVQEHPVAKEDSGKHFEARNRNQVKSDLPVTAQ